MGNRRLSKRRVKSLTEQNKGATDEWAFVRPPMVPGYSANIRVAALGPMHGFGFEDAADIPADGQTTAVWVREDENSNTIAVTSGDADFTDGAMTLTPGSGANDMCGFLMPAEVFNCDDDKPWWVEASFKIADINDCEFFFGVHESAYTTGTTRASFNSTEFTSTALTLTADNDVVRLGIMWDGKGNCKFYGAFAATGTEVGAMTLLASHAIQPDQAMGLTLQYTHTTAAADDPLTVNYVRGAWTR
jgi:hypothetical protein